MQTQDEIKSIRRTIWLSRIMRWGLGASFVAIGIVYFNRDGWPAIFFGAIMIITGFFRPSRCISNSCDLPVTKRK